MKNASRDSSSVRNLDAMLGNVRMGIAQLVSLYTLQSRD